MKLALLAFLVLPLSGASIDSTWSIFPFTSQYCVIEGGLGGDLGGDPCPYFNATIKQFDPALGKLNSIDWTFTGNDTAAIDIDNCPTVGYPSPIPYTYNFTMGDSLLGASTTSTKTGSQVNYWDCAGLNDSYVYNWLQASGSLPVDSQFIGTGSFKVPVTLILYGSIDTGDVLVGEAISTWDSYDQLTVTYNYTPEPHYDLLLIFSFSFMFWRFSRRSSKARLELRAARSRIEDDRASRRAEDDRESCTGTTSGGTEPGGWLSCTGSTSTRRYP